MATGPRDLNSYVEDLLRDPDVRLVSNTRELGRYFESHVFHPNVVERDTRDLDLAFALDCTDSMKDYMSNAIETIRHIIEELVSRGTLNPRFALIEFEDHPPPDGEDKTRFVTHVHNFTSDQAEMLGWLDRCTAVGGGDGPEAVADALQAALDLSWNHDATKICILIVDAPPHGRNSIGDSYPTECPCKLDPKVIAAIMSQKENDDNIILYTVGVETPRLLCRGYYEELAQMTSGDYFSLFEANGLATTIINDIGGGA